VTVDTGWLELNGWVTADGGLTYAFTGTYGTATLNLATNVVTYLLDNARPATKAIAVGRIVTEPFTIQVITASGITAQATVKFTITVNSGKASDLAEGRSN
jgi:VCBS repeat-containing protein